MTDAQTLTLDLGGKWYRSYGAAPCPVCQPERQKGQNALTLADGKERLLLNCKKAGCDFTDILNAAGVTAGDYAPPDPVVVVERQAQQREQDRKRAMQAQRLWDEALPIKGTVAETYLRGRGITCPLSDTLRYMPDCWHGPTAIRRPAMIALVEGSDRFAVHRTYLKHDGSGKADTDPAKMMLGSVSGGAVRLRQGHDALAVGEGIETALSLSSGLLNASITIWATLSTSGMKTLRLPSRPSRLTIATDGEQAGREAGYALAERANTLGWKVSLLPAPDGRDWNDILNMKGAAT
ncbi:conjugative transfer relaxase protein TraI [Shimia thalassica]|uniref:Conjugative transfer relaxase protein TraI n=1 Tax=Shimia thalassica TaxID=1715693 RepID=A0A0P1IMI6_9RHOB|nr:toprim domain-containing protein [Shimia thalassica]CUK08390.1 conjugative transfer relaxase protein TraI [Shimia thalassica]